MTEKDVALVASVIASVWTEPSVQGNKTARLITSVLAMRFAEACEQTNDQFDWRNFLHDCGIFQLEKV